MPILKNAKHEHFASLVAKGENPTKAYVAVGYSAEGAYASASRLLKKAEVEARIAELIAIVTERAIEKTGIDKAWVMAELVEIVKMGKAAEPVTDADGAPTGVYKQNLAAANRALELIGKEFKMFVDRSEVLTGPLDSLEHDELKEIRDAITALTSAGITLTPSAGSTRH